MNSGLAVDSAQVRCVYMLVLEDGGQLSFLFTAH